VTDTVEAIELTFELSVMEHTGMQQVVDVEWKFGGNNSFMLFIPLHSRYGIKTVNFRSVFILLH
jgi:hypothetical protein